MTSEPLPFTPLSSASEAGMGKNQIAAEPAPLKVLPRKPGAIDVLSAVLVCVLAFLLASTPARNSDLWLHLASGRLLAQGQSPRGTAPFSSTAANTFWVNHSWLWDAVLYELHELGGGQALVFTKAVLAAVLAGLFFCFRRRDTGMLTLSFAAVVAVLALGPWLLLQSTLLSLLGMVLTLYLLERPSLVESDRANRSRSLRWLLVPLFALWANLDGWFVLGPVLVGLYAVGEALRRGGDRWLLGLLTLAGLAACFLTPYHYHIFAWPAPLGLSPAEQALMRDPLGQGLVVSPFGARFAASPMFASPGAWAYYLLLAAGLASFALCGRAAHLGRLLVWLALAALSIYQARAIPFFAVAAGPILALNIQESRAGRLLALGSRLLALGSRLLALGSIVLLVLAWPGWLQPRPWQPRGWTVEPNGSLVRLARRLEKWHAEQRFRPDRFALTFSPEVAHHLAWFCPAEKGFLDSRWPLFNQQADDFVRMRRYLLQSRTPGPDPELGPLLDAYHIDRIILYDPDWDRTTRAYTCLLLGRDEWEMLALEGAAVLFGRRSAAKSSSPWKPYNPRQAAYHPEPDRRASLAAPRPPRPPGPLDPFFRARSKHAPDQGEAALHLIRFDLQAQSEQAKWGAQWLLAQATGLIGSAPGGEPGGTACTLAVRLHLTPLLPIAAPSAPAPPPVSAEGQQAAEQFAAAFLALHDTSPTESLLLAVRAARRALSANPDDAQAYLVLGEAYLRLMNQPRAQPWQAVLPELAAIRRVQALAALEQAVLLRPDLDEAHALLADLYYRMGQLDRALDHLHARLRIAGQEAGKSGPDARAAAERQAGLSGDVEAMEKLVRRSLDIYEANIAGKTDPSKVYDRARVASRHGLSRKALEMLLESYPAIFGAAGAQLQLELMLQAGRAFEVRAWLEPKHEAVLGFRDYHWLQAQAAAAYGDYAAADAELDALGEQLRQVGLTPKKLVPVRSAAAFWAGGVALAAPARAGVPAALADVLLYFQPDALRRLSGPASLLRTEANLQTLRGLLALEPGAVETAREHLRAALEVWGDGARAATGGGLDFPARPLAQEVNRLLEEASEKN